MEENKPFETAKIKMEMLTSQRPSAFRSTIWHSVMRIIFFILGIITLIISIAIMNEAYQLYEQYEAAANMVNEWFPQTQGFGEAVVERIPAYVIGGAFFLVTVTFFLSLALFLLARYCRKIIKRNNYIIQVEDVWAEMNKPIITKI